MTRAIIVIEDNADGTMRIDMAHDRQGGKRTPATELLMWLFRIVDEAGTDPAANPRKGKQQ